MSIPTATHWGNYRLKVKDGRISGIDHYCPDVDPTPLARNLLSAQDPNTRIDKPAIRASYLENPKARTGHLRGSEKFIEVSWDTALDLAADALSAAIRQHGNESIFGGSYGWSSAGRFHHAQSQVHRFLNTIGGYTRSVYSYSAGAGEVIVPRVLGMDFFEVMFQGPTLEDIEAHTRQVVCFGGIALKNTQVMQGGLGGHSAETRLKKLAGKGIRFINISPIQEDLPPFLNGDWIPVRPTTDAAMMLAIAHTLITEQLYDKQFVERYTVGLERFIPYLTGDSDGQIKDCTWAAKICDVSVDTILQLARSMAREKPMIGISWSLQRSEHGEQSYWLATVLAALLGTHGLPGKGVSYGYGSIHNIGFGGRRLPNFRIPSLPQGKNPIGSYIPVARLADILLAPEKPFQFNGSEIKPPPIDLIYWAGGNPFHHHQDLKRLEKAWSTVSTVVVNEPFWTATARRADIVFPVTVPMERNDLGISPYDTFFTPMRKAVEPFGEARDDYDIFSALAERLGVRERFTENRRTADWLRYMYAELVDSASGQNVVLPDFDSFFAGEQFPIDEQIPDRQFRLEQFRQDPAAYPLDTPSGRIEIFSEVIDSFNLKDCAGHPAWYEKTEYLGAGRAKHYPLHLISNQPKGKLHSQYDHGEASICLKKNGREVMRMHPDDAAARGLNNDDLVRVFNDRGGCLAIVSLSVAIRREVVELPTGAWYDPSGPEGLDVHGNPNAVTRDVGSSSLTQATTAHSCLVEVERYEDEAPPVRVHRPPLLVK